MKDARAQAPTVTAITRIAMPSNATSAFGITYHSENISIMALATSSIKVWRIRSVSVSSSFIEERRLVFR